MGTPVNRKKPKTYKGKSLKPGGGGAFKMMVDAITAKGVPMQEAKAIAAKRGRAKYGKKRFAKMGAVGRKRAAKKRGK